MNPIADAMREVIKLYAKLEKSRPKWKVEASPLAYSYGDEDYRVLIAKDALAGTISIMKKAMVMNLPREWCEKFLALAKESDK